MINSINPEKIGDQMTIVHEHMLRHNGNNGNRLVLDTRQTRHICSKADMVCLQKIVGPDHTPCNAEDLLYYTDNYLARFFVHFI